ncbi:hypothetical protein FF38_13615 [Lucilia cuprina]|uniref:Uncharacterized protein n=1 Tax=Lucilia cuprina TaxID=7375 RepID=A0A0L0CCH2_LUCCU|nr:hypothetical protein CVS40_12307 [Lucilia cuprina]KNC29159.1 hypothetical protein FF38_13615 [Lucilia cuprina]
MKFLELFFIIGCIVAGVMSAPGHNIISGNNNNNNHQTSMDLGLDLKLPNVI